MPRKLALIAVAIALLQAFPGGRLHAVPAVARQAGVREPTPVSPHRAFLKQYCVACHNDQARVAGLALDLADLEAVQEHAETWEKVVRKLRAGAMPPVGRPRPDQGSIEQFATNLETALDRAAAAAPNPGRTGPHRLNQTEYANAIRDLLALDVDVSALLPNDDLAFGFDNNADYLSLSGALLDRYLVAARRISRLAVGDPTLPPESRTYSVNTLLLAQTDRMGEDLPFGSRGGIAAHHYFPLDGEYVLKVRPRLQGRRAIRETEQLEVRVDGRQVAVFTMDPGSANYQQELESRAVRVPVKAGEHVVVATFLRKTSAIEGFRPELVPIQARDSMGLWSIWGVRFIEVSGPYNPAGPGDTVSRRRIFTCRPVGAEREEPCARQILATLARRAYRRPVVDHDLQTLVGFYTAARKDGTFDDGIQSALERLLVDPDFLFRVERDPASVRPGSAHRVSDLELASRLSFFLWSSIPDDELLGLAERHRLSNNAVLRQQVARMLADPRSSSLMKNFAAQWLHLRNVRAIKPDPEVFPEFDDNLREAFQRETELFLDSQFREDHSVVNLLDADYTFLNERLARHYGIGGVYGSHFRRVAYPDDRRAGLFGHGSILSVTSYPNRTSVVLRGKWLLENVLGAPPPPPPPDVPALPEPAEGGARAKRVPLRESMEQHRKNPVCATCHAQLDPLGFALEQFDGIGRWRTVDGETPIDASAKLSDGTVVSGAAGLRATLVARRSQFVSAMTEKLLTYALGRGTAYYDMPAVRAILRESEATDYRWSSIVAGIASSTPFSMRRSAP
jgi:mono/diheme cytochrome c family protein